MPEPFDNNNLEKNDPLILTPGSTPLDQKNRDNNVLKPASESLFPLSTEKNERSLSSRLSGAETSVSAPGNANTAATGDYTYAGFFIRLLATIVDDFILNWLCLEYIFVVGCGVVVFLGLNPRIVSMGEFFGIVIEVIAGLILVFGYLSISWLYHACYESSDAEATLGKRILNLKVLHSDGKRSTFWQATKKLLVMPGLVLITIVLFSLALLAGGQKQQVIAITGCIAGFLSLIPIFFGHWVLLNKKRQTLVDLLSRRIVVKRDAGPGMGTQSRFKLLPIDKKITTLAAAGIPLFILECVAISYCNIEFSDNSPGPKILNTTGHVMVATKQIASGTYLDASSYRKEDLPLLRTPAYAVDYDAKIGRTLICGDIPAGTIISYGRILANTAGMGAVSSIENIPDTNYAISKNYSEVQKEKSDGVAVPEPKTNLDKAVISSMKTFTAAVVKQYNLGGTVVPPDEVFIERRSAEKALNDGKFESALKMSNHAISELVARQRKEAKNYGRNNVDLTRMEEAIAASAAFPPKVNLSKIPEGNRAAYFDLLLLRARAHKGLKDVEAARIDAANVYALLNSMHGDFIAIREKEYRCLPAFDVSGATDAAPDTTTDTTTETTTGTSTDSTTATGTETSSDTPASTSSDASTDNSSQSQAKPVEPDAETVARKQAETKYLEMLGHADEKRYQLLLKHLKEVLPEAGVVSDASAHSKKHRR